MCEASQNKDPVAGHRDWEGFHGGHVCAREGLFLALSFPSLYENSHGTGLCRSRRRRFREVPVGYQHFGRGKGGGQSERSARRGIFNLFSLMFIQIQSSFSSKGEGRKIKNK